MSRPPENEDDFVRNVVLKTAQSVVQPDSPAKGSFADAVWDEFLQTYNRMASVVGITTSAGSSFDADGLRQQCLRGLVDALVPSARRWHAFSRSQKQRSRVLRTNPKLAALMEAVLTGSESIGTRECFQRLTSEGEKFGLLVRGYDDPNVLEWDDVEGEDCGDLTFSAFAKRRSRRRTHRP